MKSGVGNNVGDDTRGIKQSAANIHILSISKYIHIFKYVHMTYIYVYFVYTYTCIYTYRYTHKI